MALSNIREAKRVLKRGGRFVFSAWDRIEENVFANDVTNALAEVFPNDPPRFLARTPHGYHDIALRAVTVSEQEEAKHARDSRNAQDMLLLALLENANRSQRDLARACNFMKPAARLTSR